MASRQHKLPVFMIYVHAARLNIAQQSQPVGTRQINGARHGTRKGCKNRHADAHGLLRYFRGDTPAADDHVVGGVEPLNQHVAHEGINGVMAANIKAVKHHALPVEQGRIVAAAGLMKYFRYLPTGLKIILVLIGVKMLLHEHFQLATTCLRSTVTIPGRPSSVPVVDIWRRPVGSTLVLWEAFRAYQPSIFKSSQFIYILCNKRSLLIVIIR